MSEQCCNNCANEKCKLYCPDFKPKQPNPKSEPAQIRQFETGATRDTDVNKPSYVKALSPIVLRGYVDYLGRHRLQSDGNLRDWDNWKQGIPQEVYLDGLGRHEMAVWLLCHGFPASDNHGPVTLLDSLYGVIFNAQGMAHEILLKEQQKKSEFDVKIPQSNSGYCPDCEAKIRAAKDGETVAICEKCPIVKKSEEK